MHVLFYDTLTFLKKNSKVRSEINPNHRDITCRYPQGPCKP